MSQALCNFCNDELWEREKEYYNSKVFKAESKLSQAEEKLRISVSALKIIRDMRVELNIAPLAIVWRIVSPALTALDEIAQLDKCEERR